MKYLVSWTYRYAGSAADIEKNLPRGLEVFSRWTPAASTKYLQFLGRLDEQGGFAVIETDNPNDLTDAPSKFGPWAEYQIFPVADIAEAMQGLQQGVEFRGSIS